MIEEALAALAPLPRVRTLAVVQGLTEFLPVSSSGHLVLAEAMLGMRSDGMRVEIALHFGTLLAVFAVYGRDLLRLAVGGVTGKPRDLLWLVVATIPAVVVGLLLKDRIEGAFGSPRGAATGLVITAVVLLTGDFPPPPRPAPSPGTQRAEADFTDALLIGCAQAFALLPGVSRSGSTISAGLARGLRPDVAARLSFLMSVPAILGACVLMLPDLADAPQEGVGTGLLALGVLAAGVVGWLALRLLLSFLGRGVFRVFAVYCALLGLGALAFLALR